jgi:Protein of unknown function (DUF3426)
LPLMPGWELHAYDVHQLGAKAHPLSGGGYITVRASVRNVAQQAQPLPVLRVTLEDRFGEPIISSDVEPPAYLPATVRVSSLLSAGQSIDAEMTVTDAPNAVGFEIDACLPALGGGVACAKGVR